MDTSMSLDAAFSSDLSSGEAPFEVQFSDASTDITPPESVGYFVWSVVGPLSGIQFTVGMAACYGDGVFVIGGESDNEDVDNGNNVLALSYSLNGTTWSQASTRKAYGYGDWGRIETLLYANGIFIAAGYGNISKSTNGADWDTVYNADNTDTVFLSSAYFDGNFVVSMAEGIAFSADAMTWTVLPIALTLTSLISVDGVLYGVCGGIVYKIESIEDITNWAVLLEGSFTAVAHANGVFLLWGDLIYTTEDFVTLTPIEYPETWYADNINGIGAVGSKFYIMYGVEYELPLSSGVLESIDGGVTWMETLYIQGENLGMPAIAGNGDIVVSPVPTVESRRIIKGVRPQ
jgi:hypothetical protein